MDVWLIIKEFNDQKKKCYCSTKRKRERETGEKQSHWVHAVNSFLKVSFVFVCVSYQRKITLMWGSLKWESKKKKKNRKEIVLEAYLH